MSILLPQAPDGQVRRHCYAIRRRRCRRLSLWFRTSGTRSPMRHLRQRLMNSSDGRCLPDRTADFWRQHRNIHNNASIRLIPRAKRVMLLQEICRSTEIYRHQRRFFNGVRCRRKTPLVLCRAFTHAPGVRNQHRQTTD